MHLEVNSNPQHTGALSVPMRLPKLPSHNNNRAEKSFQAFKLSDNKPRMGRRHRAPGSAAKKSFLSVYNSQTMISPSKGRYDMLLLQPVGPSLHMTTYIQENRRTTTHCQGNTMRANNASHPCTVPTSVTLQQSIPLSQGNGYSLKCQPQPLNDLYLGCNNFKVFIAIRCITLQQWYAISLKFK